MDSKDKELLNFVQDQIPLCARPFRKIGEQLGLGERQVLYRLQHLKNNGYIRRIGGIFNSRKLGYTSTLCAMKVPSERIEEVAAIINTYPGVTHNYIRKHSYNMWFTLIEKSNEAIEATLLDIRRKTHIDAILNLPAEKVFKINVNFDMKGQETGDR